MSASPSAALLQSQFETLQRVSLVLARSLDFQQALREVLRTLEISGHLSRGMISVIDPDAGDLTVHAVHGLESDEFAAIRYRPGEGLLGRILEGGGSCAVARLGDQPRFLDRLGLYARDLPFIAVPIHIGGTLQGVLAVQPDEPDDGLLGERLGFVELLANLIGQHVRLALEVAQEQKSVAGDLDPIRRSLRQRPGFGNLIGHSIAMLRIFEQIRMVSKWPTTVLIRGETGTGKELIANAIHYNSPRARGPYVRLNCASLPENLLESELFGHEKGAFTGAVSSRKGRFEMADGGTLFLDEIGDISPAFQAKLLRVLQEGEIERVGGGRTLKLDVRLIAATHRDLEAAVDSGDFREDLYYRLNVMPILLPPLRERLEDLPKIAGHLLDRLGGMQRRSLRLTSSAQRRLAQHHWPGNVRELENCLERAAVMSESGEIDADLIRIDRSRERTAQRPGGTPTSAPAPPAGDGIEPGGEQSERERVIAALEQAGWVQARAARLLGMTPRQIAYRVQILNIEVKQM
ncbi:MAG: nif-specific transcriptional activator NifA [Candidatus Accumulibacter sp. UW26]|jgi:Nif-specific regulatory protein